MRKIHKSQPLFVKVHSKDIRGDGESRRKLYVKFTYCSYSVVNVYVCNVAYLYVLKTSQLALV